MSNEDRQDKQAPQEKNFGMPEGIKGDWKVNHATGNLEIDGVPVDKIETEPPQEGDAGTGYVTVGDHQFSAGDIQELLERVEKAEADAKEGSAIKEELAPYKHILSSPEFTEWLSDRVSMEGEEAGPQYPRQTPEDVAGWGDRMERAGSSEVIAAMQRYARSLPECEAEAIDTNAKVFNDLYDRIEKSIDPEKLKKRPSIVALSMQEAVGKLDGKTIERYFKSHEVNKDRARVERPGIIDAEADKQRVSRKRIDILTQRARQGDEDAWMELVSPMFEPEKPKRGDF